MPIHPTTHNVRHAIDNQQPSYVIDPATRSIRPKYSSVGSSVGPCDRRDATATIQQHHRDTDATTNIFCGQSKLSNFDYRPTLHIVNYVLHAYVCSGIVTLVVDGFMIRLLAGSSSGYSQRIINATVAHRTGRYAAGRYKFGTVSSAFMAVHSVCVCAVYRSNIRPRTLSHA
jgi:hypothetical protein